MLSEINSFEYAIYKINSKFEKIDNSTNENTMNGLNWIFPNILKKFEIEIKKMAFNTSVYVLVDI